MSLLLRQEPGPDGAPLCRVNLLGSTMSLEDAEELRALLAHARQPIGINAFDADTLPGEVLEALSAALDRGLKVKVTAYRPLLAFTLSRLGLPVVQVAALPPESSMPVCRALALVGSANSLDKILHIVERLPTSEMAIFIVQHIQEAQPNLLDKLLKVRTDYSVVMPQHLVPVEGHTIYIAPPGYNMKVAHGLVYLTQDRKVNYARPAIDVLLQSLAGEYGAHTLTALLCGYGQDGTAGCQALRAQGATVLVENAEDCAGADAMPGSVIAAGHFDVKLKKGGLASVMAAALTPQRREAGGALLSLFLEAVLEHTGYDFRDYQRGTLERRINSLIQQMGFASFVDFQRAALSVPQVTERLLTELSINFTEFYRHPEQFRDLQERVLPFLSSFPLIKIWSAGCSTGEEAYSLSFMLDGLGLLEKSRIFATDINPYILDLAQMGLYPSEARAKSLANQHVACACPDLDGRLEVHGRYLKVADRYRKRILFHHHTLGQDGSFNEFQLILCRNVMIYFDEALQRRVFALFADSLHREGFLMLGPHDALRDMARQCGFYPSDLGAHLYRYEG